MGVFMKSIKNHFSLVLALLSILFSIQIFTIAQRSIDSYKHNLANNYSVIVVSTKRIKNDKFIQINNLIKNVSELSPDNVIKRLNKNMDKKNIDLLKITLPKFYKLTLKHYPSPQEIKKLTKDLFKYDSITKVEDFAETNDTIYKLLLLFKGVVTVFAITIFTITSLLIFKELRIWQYKHSERMSIMGLFGAPVWLRSAVLFRLAIIDAIIASIASILIFLYISSNKWIVEQFDNIGIKVTIFDTLNDSIILSLAALTLSLILASMIVMAHKEEV
jgi:cell division transport system permease protein